MTTKKGKIGYRRKKGAKTAHVRSRSMPGSMRRRASTNTGQSAVGPGSGQGGDDEARFDVDDGNGKEEEGDEGAEGAGRAGECPADTPAAVYRSMRDAPVFQHEKIDRRQNRWDQFFIQRENEWKETVRGAYHAAAEESDSAAQLWRENVKLRAQILKLEAPSHAPPLSSCRVKKN